MDDPYQTVLFDDIRSFLFEVPKSYCKTIIEMFLTFLGANFVSTLSCHSLYITDEFIHDELANPISRKRFLTNQTDVSITFPLRFSPVMHSSLFQDNQKWHSSLDDQVIEFSGQGQLDFARRVLEQCQTSFKDAKYSTALLWIDYTKDPKHAGKSAKNLLKSDPMNLTLWNAYAHIVAQTKGPQEVKTN